MLQIWLITSCVVLVKCVRLRTKIMEYRKNIWKVNFTRFFKERCVSDPTLYSVERWYSQNMLTRLYNNKITWFSHWNSICAVWSIQFRKSSYSSQIIINLLTSRFWTAWKLENCFVSIRKDKSCRRNIAVFIKEDTMHI